MSDDFQRISAETVRLVAKSLSAEEITANRFGPRVARKKHGLFGTSRPTDAPLQRVYIDNTQLDVTVTTDDGAIVLGRPWMTAVVDDYTAMLLGYCLSMKQPTACEILEALRHAILPKEDVTVTRLVEDESGKLVRSEFTFVWEAVGIPDEIVIDNGLDLQSSNVTAACLSAAIDITTTPPNEAWQKGRMERWFRTFNSKCIHRLPGTTFGGNADCAID